MNRRLGAGFLEHLPKVLLLLYVATLFGYEAIHRLPWPAFVAFHVIGPLLLLLWGGHRLHRFVRRARSSDARTRPRASDVSIVRRGLGTMTVLAVWALFLLDPPSGDRYHGSLAGPVVTYAFTGIHTAGTIVGPCASPHCFVPPCSADDLPLPAFRATMDGLLPVRSAEVAWFGRHAPEPATVSPPEVSSTLEVVLESATAPIFVTSTVSPVDPDAGGCVRISTRGNRHAGQLHAWAGLLLSLFAGVPWLVLVALERRKRRVKS